MAQAHNLTAWGKAVKFALLDKGMTMVQLHRQLQERGFRISRCTLSSMTRGYRGKMSDAEKRAINEILEISEDEIGRPA